MVGDDLTTANLLIEDGTITRISKILPMVHAEQRINADGLIALPGLIDAHVHIRDMKLSYKETFETATQAAAVGGFTTILDMPNTRPPTTNSANLRDKISRAEGRTFSNVGFQAALIDNASEMKRMSEHGAIAFKLYLNKSLETFDSDKNEKLFTALQGAKSTGSLVTVHAEDGSLIEERQQRFQAHGKSSVKDFLRAHTAEIEVSATRRILELAKRLRIRVHICHITVPNAVKLVRGSGQASCEATAHHLLLNSSVFKKEKTLAICVPPIRAETLRRELWELFASGRIDILASDHAPHTLEEKVKEDTWKVAPGVPGLETTLPVMFTQISKGNLSLRRFIDAAGALPAKIFGLKSKGSLRQGFDADIVLVDPKIKSRINPANFLSMAKYSPFTGMRCIGAPAYTIVNGTIVAEKGEIVGPPAGRVVKR